MAINAQKTTLHIAGTTGTAKNITAVLIGNPTKFTSVAHGLANGDAGPIAAIVGTLGTDAVKGLNGKTVTVTNVTADSFCVQLDSTGLVYTSGGTFTPSAWIKVGNLTGIKGTSDTSPDNKTTTLDDDTETYQPGLPDTGNVTLEMQCNDSDVGLNAIEAAFDAREVSTYKITYPSGVTPVRTFNGYAKSYPKVGDAPLGGIITGSIEIKRSGVVTKS